MLGGYFPEIHPERIGLNIGDDHRLLAIGSGSARADCPAEREDHVYAKALRLMRHFGFHDLLQEDASVRGLYDRPEEFA